MRCVVCQKDKLSRDFARQPVSPTCDHPNHCCLRCMVQNVQNMGRCPYPTCNANAAKDSQEMAFFKATLQKLFPEPEVTTNQKTASAPAYMGASGGGKEILVTLLNGDSSTFGYFPGKTVQQLKNEIHHSLKYEVEKQRLVYNEKEVKSNKDDGRMATLQDYGIKPGDSIYLMVLLYSIPDSFNHVIFDLFWGFPGGKCDFLDASCLAFNGKCFYNVVDYGHRRTMSGVEHSGDMMDELRKKGHHTIEVKLKELPKGVTHLFFTLSAWDSPTIAHFPNPSLKFFEATNRTKDLCKTSFGHAGHSQAVIMCSVSRHGGQWQIFSSGKLSRGNAKRYDPLKETISELIAKGI